MRGARRWPPKVEVYRDGKGEYRWRLRSGNGNVIATGGEGCTTKANALGGIKAVQRDAPAAGVVDEQSQRGFAPAPRGMQVW